MDEHNWRKFLTSLGANEKFCSAQWCRSAVRAAIHDLIHLSTVAEKDLVSASGVGILLCQKYNTEFINGDRPALRKVTEGDVAASSLMVVYVSGVCSDKVTPHTAVVTLCDGFYHVKASLDLSLSKLLREGKLFVGQKLSICAAKLLSSTQCPPLDCEEEVVLSVNYNCVRPVSPTTRLGLVYKEPGPVPIACVDPLGGLVPTLQGTVVRVLPPFFVTQYQTSGVSRVTRNAHSQSAYLNECERKKPLSDSTVQGSEFNISYVQCVTSFIVRDARGDDGLIQRWDGCSLADCLAVTESAEFPSLGSDVLLFGLQPAKNSSSTSFRNTKLFFASRPLRWTLLNKPRQVEVDYCTRADSFSSLSVGDSLNVFGLYLGSQETPQGKFFLLLLEDHSFVLLHMPAAATNKHISFAEPKETLTPFRVMHCTFVGASPDMDSDCSRVFASEYTECSQKPDRNDRGCFNRLLQFAKSIDRTSPKLKNRRDTIFSDCARVSLPKLNNTINLPDVPPTVQKETNVPYHLRRDYKEKDYNKVRIPPLVGQPTAPKAVPPAVSPHHYFYGNIVTLSFHPDFSKNLLEEEELPVVLPDSNKFAFYIGWQYGKTSEEVSRAASRDVSLLRGIFDQVLDPSTTAGVSDEKERGEEGGLKDGREAWLSSLLKSTGESGDDAAPRTTLQLNDDRRRHLSKAMKTAFRSAFFKFDVVEGELVKCICISKDCHITSLF
ncbi:BRCA2, oligonucleotide/oligosaccharide-binding, domain 1, putative [Angomonas deanei]|uniref:BRCA2, oligonucleotide/oligosaccharide-binding, domain 1, putative n=1 Tax=Angomonas deanei TaxID=59799 RepID=A0A7G2C8Z5_9TRYP|nr:BRCA2, oligonucleotide/oligosaccharide-binding, domain 1, putative [Angomonas deanei]